MIEALALVNIASALLALTVSGLMAVGFVRLAWNSGGLIRHLATGILLIHTAVFLRTLYRDVAPLIFEDGSIMFARTTVLTVALSLNLLVALAGWQGLRALHLAIPQKARGRYSLLTAAMYPPLRRQ